MIVIGKRERMIVLEIDDCDGLEYVRAKSSVNDLDFSDDMSGEVMRGDEQNTILKKYSKSSNDEAFNEDVGEPVE